MIKGFVHYRNGSLSVTTVPSGDFGEDTRVMTFYDAAEERVYELSTSDPNEPGKMLPLSETTDFEQAKEDHREVVDVIASLEMLAASIFKPLPLKSIKERE